MRTTLDLDEDILSQAKQLASQRGLTTGQVISDLARQGLLKPAARAVKVRNGVPLFEVLRKGSRAELALVNRLRDGE
jgi:hypothetical protein